MSPSSDKARAIHTTIEKAVALSNAGTIHHNKRTGKDEFRASFLIHWRPNATSHHDPNAIAYEV